MAARPCWASRSQMCFVKHVVPSWMGAEPQLRSSSHLRYIAARPGGVLSADRIQNVIQAIPLIPIFHKDHVLRDETIVRRGEYCGIAVQQK
jgi:hypothetical protein